MKLETASILLLSAILWVSFYLAIQARREIRLVRAAVDNIQAQLKIQGDINSSTTRMFKNLADQGKSGLSHIVILPSSTNSMIEWFGASDGPGDAEAIQRAIDGSSKPQEKGQTK